MAKITGEYIMSMAIEFGTFSIVLVYIMLAATNILVHLGGFYLGLFLLVFLSIAPADGGGEEYCYFVMAFILSVAAFVRLVRLVVNVLLPLFLSPLGLW